MPVRVIAAPYDAGVWSVGMGRGPEHLIGHGLVESLVAAGRKPEVRKVELDERTKGSLHHEVSAAFEIDRLLSSEVRSSVEEGAFPLVLSGNCNSCVGTLAGVRAAGGPDVGIVWLDAHADLHTPETTTSGFTDCMGLSISVGHCWKTMAAQVSGFRPVPERNALLVGGRGMEPGEERRLQTSKIRWAGPKGHGDKSFFNELESAMIELRKRVVSVYLHLDLDILDPEVVGKANEYAPPKGLTIEQVERTVIVVREHVEISAAGIASYDPTLDYDGSVLRAGILLANSLAN